MLSDQTLKSLHRIFSESVQQTDARGNKKISNPWEIEEVSSLLREPLQRLDLDLNKCFGDNFYLHTYEYLIHTDFRVQEGETQNVIIPIWQKKAGVQHIVLFDQRWEGDGKTWAWNSKKVYEPNTGLPGRPFDYPDVTGLKDSPIDENLYSYLKGIPHMPKEYFYGLSGRALRWKPGKILRFDSKQLHCTGTFQVQEKLGLLLRFPLN